MDSMKATVTDRVVQRILQCKQNFDTGLTFMLFYISEIYKDGYFPGIWFHLPCIP